MKNFVEVCLYACLLACLVSLTVAGRVEAQRAPEEASPFTLAEHVGEPNARSFFVFSTSAASYVLRHDGMGEVTYPGVGLRKVFMVKAGPKGRIDRVYSFEYGGDLLLLYEASETGYLVRLNQKTRKLKGVVTVSHDFTPPVIKDHRVVFGDGTEVPLD